MSLLLKELPVCELPRERLLSHGVESLSNVELLSIILRTGTQGESVKVLSERILEDCENISDLKDISLNKLKEIRGLGNVKSITLKAALELGRRVYEPANIIQNAKILNSTDAFRYFAKYIAHEKQENFLAIYIDTQKRYLSHKIIFKGTLNQSIIHPREVFKYALLESASAIIIMHNHPSGELHPSPEDDEVTRILIDSGNMMGIPIIDHLIVSPSDYYSYVESGKIRHE